MSEDYYKIIFYGRCRAGFSPAQVQEDLANFYQKRTSAMEQIFSGKPVIVKRSNHAEEIARYATRLYNFGMEIEIDPPLPAEYAWPSD